MLYFSELVGKKVVTEDGVEIGKLRDFLFVASEQPLLTKICVKFKRRVENRQTFIIPMEYLITINKEIVIKKFYELTEVENDELYIHKNVMDQQIIDLTGNKVVRVNDVAIQEKDKPSYYIAGVDTGLLGILRWLKLNKFVDSVGLNVKPSFLSWADIQPLELSRGKIVLRHEQEKLEKLRPEDLADHLEKTNLSNASRLVDLLDEEFAADVIGSLNLSYQIGLFKQFTNEKAAKVIELIDPDEGADILLSLPDRKRQQILELIPEKQRLNIEHLLRLSSTPIGEVMLTEVFTVKPHDIGKTIIERIRNETKDFFSFNAIYVVNDQGQLIGVFNLHELVLQGFEIPVYKFMIQNVIVVHLKTPKEIALKKMLRYKIRTLPVINDEKHILGVITVEDLIDSLTQAKL